MKTDWTKWILLILVIICLISVYFIYNYAQSEAFKCLQDPYTYALNHTKSYILPKYNIGLSKLNLSTQR
jgi:uncharacterized protein YpmB